MSPIITLGPSLAFALSSTALVHAPALYNNIIKAKQLKLLHKRFFHVPILFFVSSFVTFYAWQKRRNLIDQLDQVHQKGTCFLWSFEEGKTGRKLRFIIQKHAFLPFGSPSLQLSETAANKFACHFNSKNLPIISFYCAHNLKSFSSVKIVFFYKIHAWPFLKIVSQAPFITFHSSLTYVCLLFSLQLRVNRQVKNMNENMKRREKSRKSDWSQDGTRPTDFAVFGASQLINAHIWFLHFPENSPTVSLFHKTVLSRLCTLDSMLEK